jgi:hypothetical protein
MLVKFLVDFEDHKAGDEVEVEPEFFHAHLEDGLFMAIGAEPIKVAPVKVAVKKAVHK